MSAERRRAPRWLLPLIGLLLTVAVFHLLTLWAIPRLIMWRLIHEVRGAQQAAPDRPLMPPPADARARRVVMPSPDLLYALCAYDLSGGPLRISAEPRLDSYWSIALYAANSDNYFVLNDQQAAGRPVDLWLVAADASPTPAGIPPDARVLMSPSREGLLLMRVLVGDYPRQAPALEAARQSLRCQSLGS